MTISVDNEHKRSPSTNLFFAGVAAVIAAFASGFEPEEVIESR